MLARYNGVRPSEPDLLSNKPVPSYRMLRDQATSRMESRLEAEVLLAAAFARDRAWIFAHLDDSVEDPAAKQRFDELITRRADGMPIAYLLGEREFYGRSFLVDPAVLIPRPETELLIELALQLELPDSARLIDVGTGSGCIGLTLAAERPDWTISACDNSIEALKVANSNRELLELGRVTLIQSDLLAAIGDHQTFDLIVSNPPYIASDDPHLALGDLRFEPPQALACGNDGLTLIRRLIDQAAGRLNPQGWLLIEHGYDQADSVRELMTRAGFESVRSEKDLAGIERACIGRRAAGGY